MDGAGIRQLIDGATYLFTNEYEAALAEQKTGWSAEEILDRVGTRVVTLGAKGARIDRKGEPTLHVECTPEDRKVDPTGVGDALPGRLPRRPRVGPAAGALRAGRQPARDVRHRDHGHPGVRAGPGAGSSSGSSDAYGPEAVADVAPHVRCPRP